MKKQTFVGRYTAAVVVLSMAITLAGCGVRNKAAKSNDVNERGANQSTEIVSRQEQNPKESREKAIGKSQKPRNLEMLAVDDISRHFDDKGGMYYVYEYGEGVGEWWPGIKYVDYQAGKEVYLCNKLNCTHKSFHCTAVLPKEIRDGMEAYALFGVGDYLYLLMEMPYSDGGSSTSEVSSGWEGFLEENNSKPSLSPVIYRMRKDGTEREKVFEFESGVSVEPTVLSDGKYLYMISLKTKERVEGNTTYFSTYDRQLIRLDLEIKDRKKIMDMGSGQNIVGCNGRELLIRERQIGCEIPIDFPYTHRKEYDALLKKSREVYSLYNIDNGNLTTIKKIKDKGRYYGKCLMNGNLYLTYEGKKFIEKINLNTKNIKRIKTDKVFSLSGISISIKGKDAILQCHTWVEDDVYFVNAKTGEYAKSELVNRNEKPIEIISQSNGYLFVRNDRDKSKDCYSIISKEDYLNNRPNYKSVDMIYSGETTRDDLPYGGGI